MSKKFVSSPSQSPDLKCVFIQLSPSGYPLVSKKFTWAGLSSTRKWLSFSLGLQQPGAQWRAVGLARRRLARHWLVDDACQLSQPRA